MKNIKVKQNWFDLDSDNKYKKLGYKGFYIYISMFKFRLYSQEQNYMFVTSIALLRKETGYKTEEIFELLKLLKTLGILTFDGLSRWSLLIDDNGKIKDKELIVCYGSDVPIVDIVPDPNREGKTKEMPRTEKDKYINVSLDIFQYYKDIGLSERYYGLYCLLRFFGDINTENKSYMSIEKMSDTLGYNKDSLNKMIHEMNRKYVLYSNKRKNGKGDFYFEHHLCNNVKNLAIFQQDWIKDGIDKNIKQWDKKKDRENKSRKTKKKTE
jgi:hypothetical protein